MAQEDMTQEDRELHVFLSYDTKKMVWDKFIE